MLALFHDLSGSVHAQIRVSGPNQHNIHLLIKGVRRHYRRKSWIGPDGEPNDDSIVDYVDVMLDADTGMGLIHSYWTNFVPPDL